MDLQQRINAFAKLGAFLSQFSTNGIEKKDAIESFGKEQVSKFENMDEFNQNDIPERTKNKNVVSGRTVIRNMSLVS